MKKAKDVVLGDGLNNAISSIFAVLIGLAFGFVILLITNPGEAVNGFIIILKGGFSTGGKGMGQVLYFATPLILTGLSVGFAFKTGLFNIGAAGQFIMGAFAAVYIGVKWTFLPAPLHWMAAILAAALIGGLWALIPGLMKAYLNVHEVISTIMMNYIGMYTANHLIKLTIYDSKKALSMNTAPSAVLPKGGLDYVFYNPLGIGNYLQTLEFVPEIIDIIIACIIYFSAFSLAFRSIIPRIIRFSKNRSESAIKKDDNGGEE